MPLAITATTAGEVGCDVLTLLTTRLKDPLNPAGQGLSAADIATLSASVARLQTLLSQAQTQMAALHPSDLQLDARLAPALSSASALLPTVRDGLQSARALLAAPQVLGVGTPANYLIEVLDSTELRPGGGFVGNYGIATLSGGRLTSLHITDTYLLDLGAQANGVRLKFPQAYSWFPIAPYWSLRDSNLDADFPTDARNAEQIYHAEGGTLRCKASSR